MRVSSVYVPNGRSLDDDHYTYKLSWLDRLVAHLDADTDPSHDVIVGGDYNIAPDDRDVHNPAKLVGATHVSQPERDRLAALEAWGLVDVFRQQHADDRVYSWWDYRAGDFHQGRGMRIDLLMCSASVARARRVVRRRPQRPQGQAAQRSRTGHRRPGRLIGAVDRRDERSRGSAGRGAPR